MSIQNIFAISVRIFKQLKNDKRTLVLFFIVPIVILSLLGYIFLSSESNLTLGIRNNDTGFLGKEFSQNLINNKNISIKIESISNLKQDLLSNTIQGYIIFPQNFTHNFLLHHKISPEVYLEGSQPQEVDILLANINKSFILKGININLNTHYLYGNSSLNTLDYFGPAFIGIIIFFLVFVITSISFLRERSQGTLERLFSTPLSKADIIIGYMLAFVILSFIQSAIILIFSIYVLGIYNVGNVIYILIIEFLLAISAVNTGIFFSVFSKTEFQAVQFVPIVIIPQILLSGVIFPVSTEPLILKDISYILPITYAVQALRDIMIKGESILSQQLLLDISILLIFSILMIIGSLLTLKKTLDV